MAISLLDESKTQLTPDVRLPDALALSSESNLSAAHTHSTATVLSQEKAWEVWKEKSKGSSRPPWWMLLFCVMALSVVYWLWGQGPGVTL